ncbi:19348_t:CDS:1, partial [Gigaspora margarita]
MQENEELATDLLDPYDVSFFLRIHEVLSANEASEDSDYDSNDNITELTDRIDTINLNNENNIGSNITESPQINEEKISRRERGRGHGRGREQGRENKRGKSNTVLKREVKTLAQLLASSDFNYLKHNILLYQNFT